MPFSWDNIDTVLLDMDGTILDRRFDDYFWLEHVPMRYAEKNSSPLAATKETLYAMYKSQENSLNWTDLDYWSSQLGMDIPLLKREVDHLIAVHPFVIDFLLFLRRNRKKIHLVTNAYGKTVNLKMEKTGLTPYFDTIVSAHDLNIPKEDVAFWKRLNNKIDYNPARTMLGEDSETNLSTAREYGINYLFFISRSSSLLKPKPSAEFNSIETFGELLP
ncbi:MAG: HAD-IA family hydrolase [Desulfuromonadales bacterium]|nr:HAD-IA family hydrolase [Desulfuromonadales bacterium]